MDRRVFPGVSGPSMSGSQPRWWVVGGTPAAHLPGIRPDITPQTPRVLSQRHHNALRWIGAKQIARWEAVHAVKRRGLSIRGITRETGVHRITVKKYLKAESPPMTPSRKKVDVTYVGYHENPSK